MDRDQPFKVGDRVIAQKRWTEWRTAGPAIVIQASTTRVSITYPIDIFGWKAGQAIPFNWTCLELYRPRPVTTEGAW